MTLIDAAYERSRTTLSILFLILIAGVYSYINIPKESNPDIDIPIIYVSLHHEGIQPEDAERLLLRPLEKHLKSIEGIKEMKSFGFQNGGNIMLEFDAGFDAKKALDDVREKVDTGKKDLPEETDEPNVQEVNFSLFPVIVITLSGDLPERTLAGHAEQLRDALEEHPNVLEARLTGKREDLVEIIIDPLLLESYSLNADSVLSIVSRNNKLVAAGAMDTGKGRFNIKVPGLFESVRDILETPLKVDGDTTILFKDVATIKRTYKDATKFASLNGAPAIGLEVSKRTGKNVIETIETIKKITKEQSTDWPKNLKIDFSQDNSDQIKIMLDDLQNNIISAVLLVMIVVIAALGIKSAGLVGLAIPGSFLLGIMSLWMAGFTVNTVVLFSLIMAVGMLVDGAIVVSEYAERKTHEGMEPSVAYRLAATRMAWPIIASTATTLAAFLPLLFWPGLVGEFMKFLPLTLIATLSASLLMALVFIPTVGSHLVRKVSEDEQIHDGLSSNDVFDPSQVTGFTQWYVKVLDMALRRPITIMLGAFATLIGIVILFANFNHGIEFFPNIEPDQAAIQIFARGNLSAEEEHKLVKDVEKQILPLKYFKSIYTTSGGGASSGEFGEDTAEDLIGSILLEFKDWQKRPKANQIGEEILERTKHLVGIKLEFQKEKSGPPTGKDVQVQMKSIFPAKLNASAQKVWDHIQSMEGLRNVESDLPIPGIEWKVEVDRAQAAKFGLDLSAVGQYVRLVTNGLKVSEYRPDDSTDEVEIRVRYPKKYRTLEELKNIRIQTNAGLVPISNFTKLVPVPKVGRIKRVDSKRAMTIKADVKEGVLADTKVKEIGAWIKQQTWDPSIKFEFKGEDEEQKKSGAFLARAFLVALFIMATILVTQFNSFYSAFLILTAVIMSTIGVMIGLLITGLPFGIVMNGIGIVALAGIVVNNNIILIDTFDRLKHSDASTKLALLHTGAQRLRPVLLTTVTTILGLIPMVIALNIDFVTREVTIGAPSTQWWQQLATSIAFGLGFSTILTLIVTPAALMAKQRFIGIFRILPWTKKAADVPE